MRAMRTIAFATSLALAACAAPSKSPSPAAAVADADRDAILRITTDVYAIVSGAKGQARDWDRLRGHFVDGGRMLVSMQLPTGRYGASTFSVEEFVAMGTANSEQRGFVEAPMVTRIETFGGVGHAFSSYTARETAGAVPFARGVNSFQFVLTAKGWRIASIAWSEETKTLPLPLDLVAATEPGTGP